MEQLLVSLVQALGPLIMALPEVINTIRNSSTLTDDQKKTVLDQLESELEKMKTAVAAVRFRDVIVLAPPDVPPPAPTPKA